MKPEIKERLEKIRKGEVPGGYKETKVGIIPEDWDVKKFNEIFKVNQGLQIPISERRLQKGENRYFYITNQFLKNSEDDKTFYIENPSKNVICTKEDILMTRTGNTGIVLTNIEGVFHNNFFKLAFNKEKYDKQFIFYLLNSFFIQKTILIYAGTNTIPDLNHGDFYKIQSGVVEKPKQQKIADILSTWDKSIELKEKLIREKKEFKRGLMQKLLTGEMRFPEFTDKWEPATIKDIFEEVKRINDNVSMDIEILTISAKQGFLSQIDKFSKVIAGSSLKKYTHLLQNEFAYNKGNSKTAPFGCIFKLDIKEGLVPFVYICFRPTQMIDVDFFDFYFKHGLLDRQLKRIITSGARSDGLLNVSKDYFFNMKISLPSIEEQKKIGFVLRLIQNQIDNSIAELNQLKEQKRGLMQLLLTGIVRVEVD